MDDVTIKVGMIRVWIANKNFGFVEVPSATFPLDQYFLPATEIQCGPNPPLPGSLVRFEVGPARKSGQLPIAKKAWILSPEELKMPVTPAGGRS